MTKIEQVKEWVENLCFPHKDSKFTEYVEHHKSTLKFKIYTDNNVYHFIAVVKDNDDNYLSCQVSSRKQRAGESWTRGNDLPDGKINQNTWFNILQSIVKHEMVVLGGE
jgi:hypothetical protein